MAACQEIEDIGDVTDELTRLHNLLGLIYASANADDHSFPISRKGLLWVVGDIQDDIDRIIAGIHKIEEART